MVMGKIMGLDYGDKRIGVAISDPLGFTAQGKKVIIRRGEEEDLAEIKRLVKESGAEELVVGLPRNMDGSLGPRAKLTLDFINLLKKQLNIPVKAWDERLSTSEAEKILLSADMSRKRRKGVIDKLAAALILQNYLDARRNQDA